MGRFHAMTSWRANPTAYRINAGYLERFAKENGFHNYVDGISSMRGMAANILLLVSTSTLVDFKFSMLTKLTGSLYMAMGDHFVNNTIVNILHVVSLSGADELMVVRITIAQAVSFFTVFFFTFRT